MSNQKTNDKKQPTHSRWNTRGFISILLLLQTVVLTISGVVRYFSPRGREAHWVDWRVLGLDKDMWSSVHMVSGLAFVILAVIHMVYNWRPMMNYVRRKTRAVRNRGRELAAAAVLTVILLGLTVGNISPANLLYVGSEKLKDNYAGSVQRAPWAHAEEATIEKVCKRFGLPIADALAALENVGLPAHDSTETLSEVARKHNTSPAKIFVPIRQQIKKAGLSEIPVTSKGKCGTFRSPTKP